MKETTKLHLAMITLVILSIMVGALLMNNYNMKQVKQVELNAMLIAEDLLNRQGYAYKQLWIEKQEQLPIIEYTYILTDKWDNAEVEPNE
jgi:hypothetical protein